MKELELRVDVFFCHRVDPRQDANRRDLERELGNRIRFFPLPCSSRIETVQLMRSLEDGADKVYLLICPPAMCRHQVTAGRAAKRVAYAQDFITEVGLEKDRIELVIPDSFPISIDSTVRSLLQREASVGRSPLNNDRSDAGLGPQLAQTVGARS
jgi:F420-non-reducing hydrogenase iron-sulfur subunit